jgi:hypothetical protein
VVMVHVLMNMDMDSGNDSDGGRSENDTYMKLRRIITFNFDHTMNNDM